MKVSKLIQMQGLDLPIQNHKLKPFDITFQIRSVDEAKMLLLMFESSPTIFGKVINEIYDRLEKQGFRI